MARCDAFVDAGGAGRECKRWLGNEIFRASLELDAERLDRRPVRLGAYHHSVAAGAMDLLDDELLEVIKDVGQVLRLAATPRGYIFEDRLLPEIELHDLRHVAVH